MKYNTIAARMEAAKATRHMIRTISIIGLLILMISAIGIFASAQEEAPSGPEVLFRSVFPELNTNYIVVQAIIELEPEAAFPLHHHGGTVFATVLEGEITVEQDGVQEIYVSGESWMETPADIHSAVNASESTVRVLATFLLPPGTEPTIVEHDAELPAMGPSIPMQAVFPNVVVDGSFYGVQVVLQFDPGAGMPLHTHGGPVAVLVLEGEITLIEDGAEVVYTAGDSWLEQPDVHHEAVNNDDTPVVVAATFLLAPDAEATILSSSD